MSTSNLNGIPDLNFFHPSGCIQYLVSFSYEAGVGKTSLVDLITKGSSITRPSQTIGCSVNVKVVLKFLVHL